MNWSPQTNYHRPHHKALNTPHLAESSLSVMSLEDKDQQGLSCLFTYRDIAHAHGHNATRVVLFNTWDRSCAEAVELDLLVAYPLMYIAGMNLLHLRSTLYQGRLPDVPSLCCTNFLYFYMLRTHLLSGSCQHLGYESCRGC